MMTRTTPRIAYRNHQPALRALSKLHSAVEAGPLEQGLIELVRIRASQLNGCSYCIDVHTRDAVAAGETPRRIYALSAWPESPLFSERERAAIRLTEAVTLLPSGVEDAILQTCEEEFERDELTTLLFAIVEINAWNRLAVTARTPLENIDPED